MTVGQNIRELRLLRKLKQSDLSEMTGISRVTLGNYERGDRIPNTDAIVKIAKALMVSTSDLLPLLPQKDIEKWDKKRPLFQYTTKELLEELLRREDGDINAI